MDPPGGKIVNSGLDIPVDSAPKFFALIIGINDYPAIKPLKGAVSDAQSIAQYFHDLSIPDDHITEIYNEKATRETIIKELQDLASDERIQMGDAILIFYAGHGCEAEAPTDWGTDDGKAQGLVPYDAKTLDASGREIQILPDRTISALLDDLAEKKGDNITVIFDCCHSTSGTRDEETPDLLARLVEAKDLPPLSADIDKHIVRQHDSGGRGSIVPAGFAHRALRSHVLLAACEATEIAWESDGKGEFTKAVLSALRSANLDTLTYTELMHSIPRMSKQHPQCEGLNKTRVLFNSRLAGASPAITPIEVLDDGTLQLGAGFVQGITTGARFEVYQHHLMDPSNPCLATLEVTAVQELHSMLGPSGGLPGLRNPAYALQIGAGRGHEIKVYVSPALQIRLNDNSEWQTNFLSDNLDLGARPTSNLAEANLSLDITPENRVTFRTHNQLSNKRGITRLPHTTPFDVKRILDVLRSAAAWEWHISRTNPKPPFGNNLRIEVFRVAEDLTGWNDDGRRPITKTGENLNTSGVVNIVADPSHLYGYQIVNDTKVDLHPYLFYFDASKLSIEHYYLGSMPSSGKVDIPLRQDGKMSIGYGASGAIPFAYCLDDDQTFDVGIIKLFVTNSPINFGLIEQESPFDEGGRGNMRKINVKSRLANNVLWDTQSMVLAQYNELPLADSPTESTPQPGTNPEPIVAPAEADLKTALTPSPVPIAQPLTSQPEALNGRYGIWVVFPAALVLSCIPFAVFYFFILS